MLSDAVNNCEFVSSLVISTYICCVQAYHRLAKEYHPDKNVEEGHKVHKSALLPLIIALLDDIMLLVLHFC